MPCKKTEGANIGEWTQDYDAAVALAKEKDATIIMNFTGSDWCGWCKLMDKNVFHHADFPAKAKALNLVLVYIDFPQDKSLVPEKYTERNSGLSKKYGVGGYPTYIVASSELEKIGQLGAGRDKTPDSFCAEITATLRKTPKAIEKKAAELGDKGAEFKKSFEAISEAEKKLETWVDTKPARTAENQKLYEEFLKNIEAAKKKFDSYF